MTKSCKTCRKAEWQLTPAGHRRPNSCGKCKHDFGEAPPMPPHPVVLYFEWPPHMGAIIPEFGKFCPCWEPKP